MQELYKLSDQLRVLHSIGAIKLNKGTKVYEIDKDSLDITYSMVFYGTSNKDYREVIAVISCFFLLVNVVSSANENELFSIVLANDKLRNALLDSYAITKAESVWEYDKLHMYRDAFSEILRP